MDCHHGLEPQEDAPTNSAPPPHVTSQQSIRPPKTRPHTVKPPQSVRVHEVATPLDEGYGADEAVGLDREDAAFDGFQDGFGGVADEEAGDASVINGAHDD